VFLVAVVHGTAPGQPLSAVAWSGAGFAILIAALLLVDLRRFRATAPERIAGPGHSLGLRVTSQTRSGP
jgi:hypothetical protein